MGPEVGQFEEEFAQAPGTANVIGVGSGTDALELSLRTVGVGVGDGVMVAANAGGYGSTAARSVGARPVFADIDRDTLLIEPSVVTSLATKRRRAVVCTQLYGSVVDVGAVRSALSCSNVAIVEDCAQAHRASIGPNAVDTMGDIAASSFYPTRNLGAFGDAGAVTTDDANLAAVARELHQYGRRERYDATQEFQAFLADRGVDTAVQYPILDYRQPAFSDSPTTAPSLPNAEWACARAASFPCFSELTDDEHRQVVGAVLAWAESRI